MKTPSWTVHALQRARRLLGLRSPIETAVAASGVVDRDWYLEHYPDVARAGIEPLAHFARYGIGEGRQPNPFFTGRWYEYSAPAQGSGGGERSDDLLIDEIERSGLVDRNWYRWRYPDVAAARADPVRHYVKDGMKEGRQPNAFFSQSWYVDKHPGVAYSGLHPALHYVRHGARQGLDPHPLFDTPYYVSQNPGRRPQEALKHFLSHRLDRATKLPKRLPPPPLPIARYPHAIRDRICRSPILTRLPAVHYLAPYLAPPSPEDDGPRSIDDLANAACNPRHRIGAALRRSDLAVIVDLERRKRRLAESYAARPQRELVSVIMPTRNRLDTLGDAINSIIVQTYRNWELIVVEDGPAGGVQPLVSAYEDPRIRLVCHGRHRGHAAARNSGLDHAAGTAVVYLDDDDQYDPDFLLISLNAMRDSGKRMFYCGQMLWQGFDEATMVGATFLGILYHDFERDLLERGNFLSMSVVMHDRNLVDRCGRFDEELTRLVDWDFFLRMTEIETPARSPLILHHYYRQRTSDSISATSPTQPHIARIRKKLAERRNRGSEPDAPTDAPRAT